MLASEIERAKAAEFDRNEKKLFAELTAILPAAVDELDGETLKRLQVFVSFCSDSGIRYCPARPATVAGFILSQVGKGQDQDRIFELIGAIELLHDKHGFPNPVATGIARRAMVHVFKVEPPRSWRKQEKLLFASLPPDYQAPIARRENDRDKELRRCQNETAKSLRQVESPAIETRKEDNDSTQEARQ